MIKFASACVILTLCVLLSRISIPPLKEWNGLRFARRFLVLAYLTMGVCGLFTSFSPDFSMDTPFMSVIILCIASFQALFLSTVFWVFVAPHRLKRKVFMLNAAMLTAVGAGAILAVRQFALTPEQQKTVLFVYTVLYLLLLLRFTLYARPIYRKAVIGLEAFYDDDERKRLHWVPVSFYTAVALGCGSAVIAWFPQFLDHFIVVYTVYYIYFAGQFANYRVESAYIVKAAAQEESMPNAQPESINAKCDGTPGSEQELERVERFRLMLEKWVEEKQYTNKDISVDETVETLQTDRNFLRFYFRVYMNSDFRQWRTELRINEAQRLIREKTDIPIAQLCEEVGFNDSGNFHRLFCKIVGLTPLEFRRKCLCDEKAKNKKD